jgi:hypothetical protein
LFLVSVSSRNLGNSSVKISFKKNKLSQSGECENGDLDR